jgi:hypothetical protein
MWDDYYNVALSSVFAKDTELYKDKKSDFMMGALAALTILGGHAHMDALVPIEDLMLDISKDCRGHIAKLRGLED